MIDKKLTDDDFCDIYSKKICDNCGKCLEIDGVDIRAINIEDIAKNVEENQYLEEQLTEAKKLLNVELEKVVDNNTETEELNKDSIEDEEYIDAFDNVVYFDEVGLDENVDLDEFTEELYPGIRKYK